LITSLRYLYHLTMLQMGKPMFYWKKSSLSGFLIKLWTFQWLDISICAHFDFDGLYVTHMFWKFTLGKHTCNVYLSWQQTSIQNVKQAAHFFTFCWNALDQLFKSQMVDCVNYIFSVNVCNALIYIFQYYDLLSHKFDLVFYFVFSIR